MNILWFKDFENLSKTQNFSQAAMLGNISQPALSRRIKALEAWVGADLVDRSCHPVQVTDAGRQMLEAALQAIERLETERGHVQQMLSQPDKYLVTFAAQHSIGWSFYPNWLQAFENGFGPIMSRLRADNLLNCLEDLDKGHVDFVIAYESEYWTPRHHQSQLESIVIGHDMLIPVCKASVEGGALFDLDDESHPHSIPYLQFGPTAPIGRHLEPLIKQRNMQSRLNVVYENPMVGALRIRVSNGDGVAWLPRSLVQPDLDSGVLSLAGGEQWAVELEIRLHRIDGYSNALTRDIWQFLALREKIPLLS